MLNEFKRRLFEEFGVQQPPLRAPLGIRAVRPPGAAGHRGAQGPAACAEGRTTIISHEFMGMPTVLAAMLEPYCNFRTVFYAHEVATIRRIVEEQPGHDTMFYNVMQPGPQGQAVRGRRLRRPELLLQARAGRGRQALRPHLRGRRLRGGRDAFPRPGLRAAGHQHRLQRHPRLRDQLDEKRPPGRSCSDTARICWDSSRTTSSRT